MRIAKPPAAAGPPPAQPDLAEPPPGAQAGPGAAPGPVSFGLPGARLRGWWHPGTGRRGQVVVLCDTVGPEQIASYRANRHLALQIAAQGWPVLRFDLPGCGESDDRPDLADQTLAWQQAVAQAVAFAQGQAGVRPVVIWGLRLGALLARHWAEQGGDDLAGLVYWLPARNGKRYLRELRLVASSRHLDARPDAEGAVQCGGYRFDAATTRALLAWPALAPAPCPTLWVDEPEPLREASAAAPALEWLPCEGLADGLHPPFPACWPAAAVAHTLRWLERLPTPAPARLQAPPPPALAAEDPADGQQVVRLLAGATAGWELVATVHWPAPQATPRPAVLILPTGAGHRIGPDRLWVPWSREAAERGSLVMRLDFAGLGDSENRPSGQEGVVYQRENGQDVAAALRWLRARPEGRQVVVLGLCSGAHHGLKALAQGPRAEALWLVNPPPLRPMSDADLNRLMVARGQAGRSRWQAALQRRWQRSQRLAGQLQRGLRRWLQRPQADDVTVALRQLAEQGTSVCILHAAAENASADFRRETGHAGRALLARGAVRLVTIPDGDHMFQAPGPRRTLFDQLLNLLDETAAAMNR
jgi:pimeloyl-ACP methyl ester carboxylesterase